MSILRFSLKTVFLLTTLTAASLGLWLHGYRSGMSESIKHVRTNVSAERLKVLGDAVERSLSKSLESGARVPG